MSEKHQRLTVEQIATLNRNTENHFRKLWKRNAAANRRHVSKYLPLQDIVIEQKEKFETTGDCEWLHKIAFICGSGPSLKDAIPIIIEHREKFVVFCADTTWTILVKAGVIPDYVITLDCGDAVTLAFPDSLAEQSKQSSLIMSNVSPFALTKLWKGKIYYYTCWNDEVPTLVECGKGFGAVMPLVSRLNVGDFMLFNVGLHLGWKTREIAVSGLDFAFVDRQTYYADGTEHKHLFDELNHQFNARINNFGFGCYTQDEFEHYQQNFLDAWHDVYKDWVVYWLSIGIVPLSYDRDALMWRLKGNEN